MESVLWTNYFISLSILLSIISLVSVFYWSSSLSLMMEIACYGDLHVMLSYSYDYLSSIFLTMVSLVSVSVFIYSLKYMNKVSNKKMFSALVVAFIASMLLLSLSENIFTTLIWWDLLGLTSVCLVFFFQSKSSLTGGLVTFCSNRIGDCAIIISIVWVWQCGSHVNFFSFPVWGFVMMSAFTKSAQFPFSSWLPMAMAAPTPVSSLVHSSTLVTAGILLMVRFYEFVPEEGKFWGSIISGVTVVIASTCACLSFDVKKIIAFSTMSHISLMLTFVSAGMLECALAHMFAHALYKSSLFMASGQLIHDSSDHQDIRFMSCVSHPMPVLQLLAVSALSMIGIPLLTGAVSKEILLSNSTMSVFLSLVFFLSAFLTGMYTFRMMSFLLSLPLFVWSKGDDTASSALYYFLSLLCSVVGGWGISVIVSRVWVEKSFVWEFYFKIFLLIVVFLSAWLSFGPQESSIMNALKFPGDLWGLTPLASWMVYSFSDFSWRLLYYFDSSGVLEKVLKSSLKMVDLAGKSLVTCEIFSHMNTLKSMVLGVCLLMIYMVM